jgi:hypothetical protein
VRDSLFALSVVLAKYLMSYYASVKCVTEFDRLQVKVVLVKVLTLARIPRANFTIANVTHIATSVRGVFRYTTSNGIVRQGVGSHFVVIFAQ